MDRIDPFAYDVIDSSPPRHALGCVDPDDKILREDMNVSKASMDDDAEDDIDRPGS